LGKTLSIIILGFLVNRLNPLKPTKRKKERKRKDKEKNTGVYFTLAWLCMLEKSKNLLILDILLFLSLCRRSPRL